VEEADDDTPEAAYGRCTCQCTPVVEEDESEEEEVQEGDDEQVCNKVGRHRSMQVGCHRSMAPPRARVSPRASP